MQESAFYEAQDLADLLHVSKSAAYGYIRTMNAELAADGYLVVRGKVPAAYVRKRFFGVGEDHAGKSL